MTRKNLLMFLTIVFATAAAQGAVFLVPADEEMIAQSDGIVVGMIESQEGAIAANGDILTISRLRAEESLKGDFPQGELVSLSDPGGIVGTRAMLVSGGVQYTVGERVLVFLTRTTDGGWTTYGLSLGKMKSMRNTRGDRLFLRDMQGSIGLAGDGRSAHVEIPRNEQAFLGFIRRMVALERREGGSGHPRFEPRSHNRPAADYFTGEGAAGEELTPVTNAEFEQTTNAHYPPSAYTQGTFRWAVFDSGGSVTYYSSSTQPGFDAVGASQRALAAWTNDPGSNVRLVYGGTRTAGFVQDGINAMVYNSSTDVPSGAIGYSKWWANATHTYKGETFYSISEGDTVMRSGLAISNAAFEEAVTHEVGHTLGFRHSDQGTPSSQDAVMRSSVTGRYGATLGPWDQEAVSHVYGSGTTTPPPCTPPTITTQPASTTINRGGSVTLTVAASGTNPLYQWYIGSTGNTASPISGANAPSLTVTPSATTSYWVRVGNSCGTRDSNTATITVNQPTASTTTTTRGDFNFDGRSDLIWRNRSTGANRVWFLNNATVIGTANLQSQPDLNWRIGGAGEFNADGRQDLMWRNTATGQNAVWYMNGTSTIGSGVIRDNPIDWYVASVYHYDQNGTSDLLWRHRTAVYSYLWLMNGTQLMYTTALRENWASWELIGTGDFNSDLWQDLLWRNTATNDVYIWFMVATNLQSTTALPDADAATWAAGAILDADRNGFPDIVWRNKQTGANVIWYTAGGVYRFSANLPTEGDLNWEIAGPR